MQGSVQGPSVQELFRQATAVFQAGVREPREEPLHHEAATEWEPSLAAELGALLRHCTDELRAEAGPSLEEAAARYPDMGQLLVSLAQSTDMRCSSALVDAVSLQLAFAALAKATAPDGATGANCNGEDVWHWATALMKSGLEPQQEPATRIASSLLSRLGGPAAELQLEVIREHRSAIDREFGAVTASSPAALIERKCGRLATLVRRLTPLCTLFSFGRPETVLSNAKLCIAELLDTVTSHTLRLCGEVVPLVAFALTAEPDRTGYAQLVRRSSGLVQELTGGRSVYYHLSWNTRISLWRTNHSVLMRDLATVTALAVEEEEFSLAHLLEATGASGQPEHIGDLVRCLCEGCVREPQVYMEVTTQLACVLLQSGNESVATLMRDLNNMLLGTFEARNAVFPYSRRSLTEYYERASAELVLLLRPPCSEEGLLRIATHLQQSSSLAEAHWRTMVLYLDWVTYASGSSSTAAVGLVHWFRTGQWR